MPSLYNALIRHQLFLEGLKANQSGLAQETIIKIFDFYIAELRTMNVDRLDKLTKQELVRMLATLRDLSVNVYSKYTLSFIKFLRSLTGVQSASMGRIVKSVGINPANVPLSDINKAFNDSVWTKLQNGFMPHNGKTFKVDMDEYGSELIKSIENVFKQGFTQKLSVKEVTDRLLGVKTRMPKGPPKVTGGLFNRSISTIKNSVNTTIQYVSEVVNEAVNSKFYSHYLWVSIIDNHTTQICTDRDGNRYRYGEGPLTPAHYGCRSKTIPDDGSAPDERPSFISWLRLQPKLLQIKFLGNSKAKALEAGSLTVDDVRSYKPDTSLTLRQYSEITDLVTSED